MLIIKLEDLHSNKMQDKKKKKRNALDITEMINIFVIACLCMCVFTRVCPRWEWGCVRIQNIPVCTMYFFYRFDVWSKEAILSFGVNCFVFCKPNVWMWALLYGETVCITPLVNVQCLYASEWMKGREREGQRHNTSSFTSPSFPNKE